MGDGKLLLVQHQRQENIKCDIGDAMRQGNTQQGAGLKRKIPEQQADRCSEEYIESGVIADVQYPEQDRNDPDGGPAE